MTISEAQLRQLLDKQALYDNIMQYGRGIDRMDLELMPSAYWADGTDSHGRYEGSAHGWCEEAMKSLAVLVSCNHHIMRAPESSYWGRLFPEDPIYQYWFESPKTPASTSNRPEVGDLSRSHGSEAL